MTCAGNRTQSSQSGEDGGWVGDGPVWGTDSEEATAGQGSAGHTEI